MGALDGLLVVSIEQAVAAPMCTVRLADAGARVIKLERPEGDTARNYDNAVKGTSAYFAWLNRGKESAVLDLKNPSGLAVLKNMLSAADIFVQNLIPGAMDRMGLSREALERDFPQLISASILGYGQDTPYASMRAYDMLVQAESGLCSVTGTPDTPSKVGISVADISTGMNAQSAILEALIERNSTGRGKSIEISMFDGMVDWMAVPLLHFEHTGKVTGRFGLSHASIYPYRPFSCADGTVIIAVQNNKEFLRLVRDVIGNETVADRAEFQNNADRVQNRDALDRVLEPFFAAKPTSEIIKLLQQAGVAYGRYTELSDLPSHQALRRFETILPNGQTAAMPRPPGRDKSFAPGPVPSLGEHTQKVIDEFAKI